MRRIGLGGVVVALTLLVFAGCRKPADELVPFQPEVRDYSRPLPPGALALRKIPPEQYPDFGQGFGGRPGLREAIQHSLAYLAKPSSQRYFPYGDISHARAVASLQRFLVLLDTATSPAALNAAIRNEFDVYQSVGFDDRGSVYFTGYYTPIFDGRRQRSEAFRYPLYRLPPDLVKDPEGRTLGRRTAAGTIEPRYPTRREIESGRLLDGLEIAWVRSAFEAYIITVQGSAKLRLGDGRIYEVGYAGNNGHEYTPVALELVRDGHMTRDEVSLQAMRRFFEANPRSVYAYCWKNDRYVFFQEAPGGPFGSLNTPVIPFRSLATDKEVFPRACLSFLQANLPTDAGGQISYLQYGGFALDQDTGGAIRAAGRCDIYMGVGPQAEALAGRTGSEGQLYYIFVKQ